MTDERCLIENLSRCRFVPGSFNKRFVRDLASGPEDAVLTVKQRQTLWKIGWRWRRQLPRTCVEAMEKRRRQSDEQLAFEDQLDMTPDVSEFFMKKDN